MTEAAAEEVEAGARPCSHDEMEHARPVARGVERERPRSFGATLEELYSLIERRRQERPEGSYTTYLFGQGLDNILKKVGEEAAETIIAAKNGEAPALVAEVSDLGFSLPAGVAHAP